MTRKNACSLAIFSLAALVGACEPKLDEADEFRRGVPRKETVEVKVPAGALGKALTVESQSQALRGQVADMYVLTYGVTRIINGGGFFVGALVRAVLDYPPSDITGNTATWGPWTDDLEPITWRVTITRVADLMYQYRFDGQPRGNAGAPFVTVLAGTHVASADDHGDPVEGFGAGSFTLDWDVRNNLPQPNPKEVGKAHYAYSRLSPDSPMTVEAQFRNVRDEDTGKLVDVDYAYGRNPGAGGGMDFTEEVPAQAGMPAARLRVRSRWQSGGAGRSDAIAASPDLPMPFSMSECWSGSFLSTFKRSSFDPAGNYGNEATDCVFPTAELSKL